MIKTFVAFTLIFCLSSLAAGQTIIDCQGDGNLRHSAWAGYTWDGSVYVLNYPYGHFLENGNYGDTEWSTPMYTSVGPGHNGTDYFFNSNPPSSTWCPGHELDPYVARPWFQFDISSLGGSLGGASAVLSLHQGGYGTVGGAASGLVYRMTNDPVNEQANWNYRNIAGSLAWTTAGGDYDANVSVPFSYTTVGDGDAHPEIRGTEVRIDVTPLVQAALDQSDSIVTLMLIMNVDATPLVDDDDVFSDFFSIRRAPSWAGNEPELEIVGSVSTYALTVVSGSGDGNYIESQLVPITAVTAPSGQEFDAWVGNTGGVADVNAAATTITMPATDATVTATFAAWTGLTDYWPAFSAWCNTNFGAEKEPLAYQMFGNDLVFTNDPGSEWSHVSETSSAIAFETNLPARTFIEYGETTAYGSIVAIETDRYHYLHLAYLTGLSTDTTYHYRYVAEDERGNAIQSPDKTLTTATPPNVEYVPGSMSGPPYILGPNKYYLLTEDIVADGTAFQINGANTTLDLGGHTIIYNNVDNQVAGDWRVFQNDSAVGVRAYDTNATIPVNVKLVNGTIIQGAGQNSASTSGVGYTPVIINNGSDNEVAGVTVDYIGASLSGMRFRLGNVTAHHNVLLDRGGIVLNRHLQVRALNSAIGAHHNLILRARQGALIDAHGSAYDNEIYVDSFVTNSFGISMKSNIEVYGNRFFGGGYYYQAIGAVGANYDFSDGIYDPGNDLVNADIHDNFVHLQGEAPFTDRSNENGNISRPVALRMMWGCDNVSISDNMLIVYGRDGTDARAVWTESEEINRNVVFRDNLIKMVYTNTASDELGTLVLNGEAPWTSPPDPNGIILFEGNRIESNFSHISFCEPYGTASYVHFKDNTFAKIGPARGDYSLIQLGYWDRPSKGHLFVDSTFEGGCSYDDVQYLNNYQWITREFTVGWTLTVETTADANVIVDDLLGTEVFNGQADANGICRVELNQYLQRQNISSPYNVIRDYETDHTVTVETDSESESWMVTMDAAKTIQILQTASYLPGDLNEDGNCNITDLNMVLIDWGKSGGFVDANSDGNEDGTINITDLNLVLIDWGK